MSYHWNNVVTGLVLAAICLSGLVSSEWEVLNADLEYRDDDVFFMPASQSSTSSLSSSPSSSLSSNKRRSGSTRQDAKSTLAKKTYLSTPAVDPLIQFQNVALSTNQKTSNNDDVTKPSSSSLSPPNQIKSESKSKEHSIESKSLQFKEFETKVNSQKNSKTPEQEQNDPKKNSGLDKRKPKESKNSEEKPRRVQVEEYNNNDVTAEDEVLDIFRPDKDGEKGTMEDVDCENEINVLEFDCIELQNENPGVKEDSNLSQAADHDRQKLLNFMKLEHRVRRALEDEAGSGDGNQFEEEEQITDGEFELPRTITFQNTTETSLENATKILEKELNKAFKKIKGFQKVKVNNVKIDENGKVSANYTLTVNTNGFGAYGGNEIDLSNRLQFQMLNLSEPLYNNILVGGRYPDPLDVTKFAENVATMVNDVCTSVQPCNFDFDNCNSTGYTEGKCTHKCIILENGRPCEHGGACDLENPGTALSKAFCQCTSNWEGEYCQNKIIAPMTAGKITGITVGAALAFLSLVGCCCWFVVCRRRRKPLSMTHYADSTDSSERFTSPSSKISTFVIDRPRIRTDPIRTFNPYGHDDFSRPSSLSTLPPLMGPRDPAQLFSDA